MVEIIPLRLPIQSEINWKRNPATLIFIWTIKVDDKSQFINYLLYVIFKGMIAVGTSKFYYIYIYIYIYIYRERERERERKREVGGVYVYLLLHDTSTMIRATFDRQDSKSVSITFTNTFILIHKEFNYMNQIIW